MSIGVKVTTHFCIQLRLEFENKSEFERWMPVDTFKWFSKLLVFFIIGAFVGLPGRLLAASFLC